MDGSKNIIQTADYVETYCQCIYVHREDKNRDEEVDVFLHYNMVPYFDGWQ